MRPLSAVPYLPNALTRFHRLPADRLRMWEQNHPLERRWNDDCLAHRHIAAMSQRLQDGITSQLDGVVLNGPLDPAQRYVGNLNLSFSYVEGESLIMGLKVHFTSTLLRLFET